MSFYIGLISGVFIGVVSVLIYNKIPNSNKIEEDEEEKSIFVQNAERKAVKYIHLKDGKLHAYQCDIDRMMSNKSYYYRILNEKYGDIINQDVEIVIIPYPADYLDYKKNGSERDMIHPGDFNDLKGRSWSFIRDDFDQHPDDSDFDVRYDRISYQIWKKNLFNENRLPTHCHGYEIKWKELIKTQIDHHLDEIMNHH